MLHLGQDGIIVLNVAEKNDAAKNIAQIMSQGRSTRREGFSKFNKIYDFNYNILKMNCKMVMTSVSGHLLDMDFSGHYSRWNDCSPLTLFEAPITKFVPNNFTNIKRTLQREIRHSQTLIIWTDGDREGENIGFEIIEVCRQVKPDIQVYRAKFSEITPRAINIACQNLGKPDQNLSDAVEVRRELDLRIGASFTRFQTLRLQRKFPNVLANQLISYGSCQFPTLGFVVERYRQVENFMPETFYKIRVQHTKDDCLGEFNWERGRLFNQRLCAVFSHLCKMSPVATVISVTSKPKRKWRPLPLETIELEKLVSMKLKIKAKETMKVAEKLYTQGFISYPRTETNIFPKGMDLTYLVQNQTGDTLWGAFAKRILEEGGPNPRQGKKTDNAHPPIHPTKYATSLQGNEKRIYEFIVRHFLACVFKDAEGQETHVEVNIAGEKFSVNGLQILAQNYLDVYCYEYWNSKTIPHYSQGETFQPDKIEMINGETRAPPLLSEADLISLMDKYGIGTDATHAEHIETIKARSYVGVQNDGNFVPGQLGMGLVEGYDAMGFAMSKPYLRARLEADLKCICDGTKKRTVVLAEQIRNYKEVFQEATEQVEELDKALAQYFGEGQDILENEPPEDTVVEPIRKCPQCKINEMVLKKTKEGRWLLGCVGYPNCRNSVFFPKSVLQLKKSMSICTQCEPRPVYKLHFKFKKGSVPPMMQSHYVGCVAGCDEMLMGIIRIQETLDPNNGPSNDHQLRNNKNQCNYNRKNNDYKDKKNCGDSTSEHIGPGFGARTVSENENVKDNHIVCECNETAKLMTVKKSGPNSGRQFYRCNKARNQCNFFLWSDTESDIYHEQKLQQHRNKSAALFDDDEASHDVCKIQCNCNQKAALHEVQKDCPNKGRQFYCCAKSRDQQCGFFQWVEEGCSTRKSFSGRSGRGGHKRGDLHGGKSRGRGNRHRKRTCGGCGEEGHTKRSCRFMK